MFLFRKALTVGLLMVIALGHQALGAEPKPTGDATKAPAPPEVGKKAPDFSLQSVRGQTVKLSKLAEKSPVVLVVLRGYPGYQCPICSRQVGELLQNADELAKAGAQVVLVYPGPSGRLKERAEEFLADRTIPKHFHLVMDPDYTFTKAYGLRWDAPRETAYPSTFVIDRQRIVRFARVSKTHGGRTDPKTVLKAMAELPKSTATR
ncbi:MAG: peroxiredoxin family protein [Pirellulales bacterium]